MSHLGASAAAWAALGTALLGCSGGSDESSATAAAVTMAADSQLARAQFDADLAFVRSYKPRCQGGGSKRVLVTGFGRFGSHVENASGRIVSLLAPSVGYPVSAPPAADEVSRIEDETRAGVEVVRLPKSGDVSVCAMVLPVRWDASAALILKEIAAFSPQLVVMTGIYQKAHPLYIELGARNQVLALGAMEETDGSQVSRPAEREAPVVESAPAAEFTRGNLLSWRTVREAAVEAAIERGGDKDGDTRFDDRMPGARLAPVRRANTYVCNNTTYAVGYVMDHPGAPVSLMRAAAPKPDMPNEFVMQLGQDNSQVPRVFLHWPTTLKGAHLASATHVLRAVLDAQLASMESDPPTRGHNGLADPATLKNEL